MTDQEKEEEIRRKNLLNQRNQVFTKCLNKFCIYWRKSNYPAVGCGVVTKVDTKQEIVEIQEQQVSFSVDRGIVEYDTELMPDKLTVKFADLNSIGPVNRKAILEEIRETKQKRIDAGGPFNLSRD